MALRWCLGHKVVVIITVTVIFVGSLFMAPRLATEFFPKVDAGSFILNVSGPEGTTIEKTEAIVARIEGLVREAIPDSELDQGSRPEGAEGRRPKGSEREARLSRLGERKKPEKTWIPNARTRNTTA